MPKVSTFTWSIWTFLQLVFLWTVGGSKIRHDVFERETIATCDKSILGIFITEINLILHSAEKQTWPFRSSYNPTLIFYSDRGLNKFSNSNATRWSIIVPFSKSLMSAALKQRKNRPLFCLITACQRQDHICIFKQALNLIGEQLL